jgi:Methyltransferase domain
MNRKKLGVEGDIAERLESLDVSLFDGVPTQSSKGDREAWLAVQRSVRLPSGYSYLEIGSHLGGSIQQHLLDPLCRTIFSIDKRPLSQPDDRGQVFQYEGNSTDRMLENLRQISTDQVSKLTCFDGDARDIDDKDITAPPDFCFIDGEHTHTAVLSDFEFCLRVCSPDAAICFHDDYIIHRAIGLILSRLRRQGVSFTARKLSGATFGIFLGNCPAGRDPYILSHSKDETRWLRGRRLRHIVPVWLRPAARWMVNSFGRQRQPA